MTTASENRNAEIRAIQQKYLDFYRIFAGLGLIAIGIWIGSLIFHSGYATNVYTESLSVIATIAVLDRLNDWRETRRLKRRLIRESASRDNSTALNAVDWMRSEGWLTVDDIEPLLVGAKMSRANLENAYLYETDLSETNFYKANLNHVDLSRAKFTKAFLHRADLVGATVFGTDFSDTILWKANLRDVKYIKEARFNTRTVLPDARPLYDDDGNMKLDASGEYLFDKYWSEDTDMTRYTNPEHRDYWEVS